MSTKRECPEKYGWWRNGLGVIANKRNELITSRNFVI